MSRIRVPENIEIASLKQKQAAFFDAMAPGSGTPWEDRGTHGTVGAFIKTCTKSLGAPAVLLDSIRRPETTGDAMGFFWGCAALWGLSAFIHSALLYPHYSHIPHTEFNSQLYWIYCGIAFVAGMGGVFIFFRLFNTIYAKMMAQEKTQRPLPETLIYNITAYCMGPSLLAIIPVIGPPLALAWILADVMIAGKKRLNIGNSGAVINALLPMIIVVVLAVVGWLVGRVILHQVLGDPVTDIPVDLRQRT